MLAKLTICLEKRENLNQNIGSILQGIIMEKISEEYAAKLHTMELNPYSQSVLIRDDTIEWTICTMTDEAKKNIIEPIMLDKESKIVINNKNLELAVLKKELKNISYEELMDTKYFGKCPHYLQIQFNSPTAFKVAGNYQNYPTVSHIFQSLIRKYDAVSEKSQMFSTELINEIEEHVVVTKYNLRSTFFHLEGIKIPAFKGNITFKIYGPQMFANLLHFLAAFGEYSGIGIKTSIGMGDINIVDKSERK